MQESIDLDTRKHCSDISNSLLFNLMLEDHHELSELFLLSSILRMSCLKTTLTTNDYYSAGEMRCVKPFRRVKQQSSM